ncbi:hypothetical protein PGB90_004206 [Kerria lacca]
MKLSTVFELLLIFLIIAFAASKVIDIKSETRWKPLLEKSANKEFQKFRQSSSNKFCSCSNLTCNCCREFSLPAVPLLNGPGCASLKYLQGDSIQVTMSFGNRILRNVTISGKKPKPICMSLPGGVSKFCGRIYGISRDAENLRACLGLELRSQEDVEAALRVSCFKFGSKGLNVEPGKPVPTDEEDDDDDDFGFPGAGDDDDDDDDDDNEDDDDDDDDDVFGLDDDDDDDDEDDDDDDDNTEPGNTVESAENDYAGFSALGNEFLESFFESDSPNKKKKPSGISGNIPQLVTLKPSTIPFKKLKPQKGITTKLVILSPIKTTERATTTNEQNVNEKLQLSTAPATEFQTTAAGTNLSTNMSPLQKFASAENVYLSPSQYKPTEKIRPTPNQPPPSLIKNYFPTIFRVSTEKVYTSPQQMPTEKVYISTINQQTNTDKYGSSGDDSGGINGGFTIQNKEQPTINYYIPTTQQFLATEKVYIPTNLSTMEPLEYESVTSTSMTVNIIQTIDETNKKDTTAEKENATPTMIDNFTMETTPDSEYNEVDSNSKTKINRIRFDGILSTVNSIIPLNINKSILRNKTIVPITNSIVKSQNSTTTAKTLTMTTFMPTTTTSTTISTTVPTTTPPTTKITKWMKNAGWRRKTTTEHTKHKKEENNSEGKDENKDYFEVVVDTEASVSKENDKKYVKNNSKIYLIEEEVNMEEDVNDSDDEDSNEDGTASDNNKNTNVEYINKNKEDRRDEINDDEDNNNEHNYYDYHNHHDLLVIHNDNDDDDADDADADDDDDDNNDNNDNADDNGDEFRKFADKTKMVANTTTTPISTHVAIVHNDREHKRMNLPPLFSQNPEISSFWSSGGHLYKIRMSPMIQESFTTLQNSNRLGKLNLFVPAITSNRSNDATYDLSTKLTTQFSTYSPNEYTNPTHRFNLHDVKNQISDRNYRNHKRMKIPTDDRKSSS